MNDTAKVLLILIGSTAFILALFLFIFPNIDNDCLKEKAEDYCESQETKLGRISSLENSFTCIEDERIGDRTEYRILKEEIESCTKKNYLSFKWRSIK